MNAVSEIFPIVEADAGWSAATERVACYLRAHRLASPGQVTRLTADIIAIAQAQAQARPGAEPMTLAMETMDSCMKAWFAQLLPADEMGETQLLARGRVALAMGGVPARWPDCFMSSQSLPVELVRVMREAELGRAPEIKFSNMAPRLIVESVTATSRLKWQLSYRWPFLRIVTGLMVVLSLFGATLAAGR
jgi:hypothetical protein